MKLRRQLLLKCEVGVPESLVGESRTCHPCGDRAQRPGRSGEAMSSRGAGAAGDLPTGPLPQGET